MAARMTRWLGLLSERGRASQFHIPKLCVYHWTGGVCSPCEVEDISEIGAYLKTQIHWSTGTFIELTLQRMPGTDGNTVDPHALLHVRVVSKVVRSDPGGIGVHFIFKRPHERLHIRNFLAAMQAAEATGTRDPLAA